MHVRNATLADVPAIVRMGEKFYSTTDYTKFAEFCPESVASLATMLIEQGVCLVVGDDPIGMVGLYVGEFPMNRSKRAAYEVMWWVEPDAQGQGAGKSLLQAVEPACREAGCHAIQMLHLSTSPPQAAALYERMGYPHTESTYTKVL